MKKNTKRVGKAQILNFFYKNFTSDIFVSFDADSILSHDHVLSELVKGFTSENVGLVGGLSIPSSDSTVLGKSLATYEYFWQHVITHIHTGNNVHTHRGPISAGSKKFLRQVTIPKYIVAEDHFLYFEARRKGFAYVFRPKATVTIKLPSTLHEYFSQQTRFIHSAEGIRKHFGPWVENEYTVPYKVKLDAYLDTGKKHPFYLLFALGVVSAQRLYALARKKKNTNPLWAQIESSK